MRGYSAVVRSNILLLLVGLLCFIGLSVSVKAQVSENSPPICDDPKIVVNESLLPPPYINAFDAYFQPSPDYDTSGDNPPPVSIPCNVYYEWTYNGANHFRVGFADYHPIVPYNKAFGAFQLHCDLTSNGAQVAMTPTGCVAGVYGVGSANGTGQMASLRQVPPYLLGVTLLKIATTDGKPLPAGSVVTMQNHFGADYGQSIYPLAAGFTQCVLGQGEYHRSDAPYAFGLVSDTYDLWVTAPGYFPAEIDQVPGNHWAGNTIGISLSPNSYTTPTQAPTTAADNPDAPPSSTGTTGSTGGSGGTSSIDFSGLFTINPDDLTALQTALGKFMTYGPFGAIAALHDAYTAAFASTNTSLYADGSAPDYWTIYLNHADLQNATASQAALPAGYNPYAAYQPPAPTSSTYSSFYSSLFPTHYDLLPYASFILDGRRLALVALWGGVVFNLLRRFTPSLRI